MEISSSLFCACSSSKHMSALFCCLFFVSFVDFTLLWYVCRLEQAHPGLLTWSPLSLLMQGWYPFIICLCFNHSFTRLTYTSLPLSSYLLKEIYKFAGKITDQWEAEDNKDSTSHTLDFQRVCYSQASPLMKARWNLTLDISLNKCKTIIADCFAVVSQTHSQTPSSSGLRVRHQPWFTCESCSSPRIICLHWFSFSSLVWHELKDKKKVESLRLMIMTGDFLQR